MALARALITQPSVLLLDEPLSALDPFLRVRMRAELKRLQKELGITFVHVTHSQEEAMALADLVVVMNGGRIEQAGRPATVFNRPAPPSSPASSAATTSSSCRSARRGAGRPDAARACAARPGRIAASIAADRIPGRLRAGRARADGGRAH